MLTHVLRFKEKQVSVSSVSRRVLKFKQVQAVCANMHCVLEWVTGLRKEAGLKREDVCVMCMDLSCTTL